MLFLVREELFFPIARAVVFSEEGTQHVMMYPLRSVPYAKEAMLKERESSALFKIKPEVLLTVAISTGHAGKKILHSSMMVG